MSQGDREQPDDTLEERVGGGRIKLWLLLEADRRTVTALLVAVLFVSLVAIGVVYPGARRALRTGDPVETLFQALVTATITGVTLVLTLNQLVLSQELGAVGDQRERMVGAMEFRSDAAALFDAPVSPARPAQFLRAFVETAALHARELRDAVDGRDEELERAVVELTDSLIDNADRVSDELDGAAFGEFDVVAAALDFNYSWKIFEARRIATVFAEPLDNEATRTLDALIDVLRLFGPAREHFKTLYFQWELIDLSKTILAAAIPALLVAVGMMIYVDVGTVTGTVFGIARAVVVVAAGTTVSLLPFVVLLAYVLRIATVTKHTLSIGPFILRDTEAIDPIEWEQ